MEAPGDIEDRTDEASVSPEAYTRVYGLASKGNDAALRQRQGLKAVVTAVLFVSARKKRRDSFAQSAIRGVGGDIIKRTIDQAQSPV